MSDIVLPFRFGKNCWYQLPTAGEAGVPISITGIKTNVTMLTAKM
ncbi:MAG TPA: hypothetical protein PKD94_13890 [Ignavibacteria bacterium]|nr:hypothetical protein [Ignavibacteria bacterium]